jgi:glycosyltransferase involved in cell wall biosynthesis
VHSAETFLPISEQAAAARVRDGFRLVLTCWENIPFLHENDPRIAARKHIVRSTSDLFLAVTERARQALLLENVPGEQIVVQPMGVDRQVFRPLPRDEPLVNKWSLPDGWSTILYCGRLLREKGLLDLILALVALAKTILVIVGEGPERTRLERAAQARGISDRVRFVGGFEYIQMARVYSIADVFCLPSLSTPYWQEQFGMVLVEAMACGVPVLSTATGSIPEVVGDAAVLVPAYAVEQLREGIASLLEERERRDALAAAGLQRVAERYDANRVAESIGKIYERVLE